MGRINKRGTAMDLIYLTISVLIVAVVLLVLTRVWEDTEPALQEALGTESEEINHTIAAGSQVIASYDYMLLGAIVAIFISMIILAMMIPANPVFTIIYIIIMIVNILLCAVTSNVYKNFSSSDALTSAAASMPMQNFIMMNLPLIMFALGLLVLVVTFSKPYIFGGEVR